MKIYAILFTLLYGSLSWAWPIAFDSALVRKDTANGGWLLVVNRNSTEWCTGFTHGVQFAGFQAAKDIEAMSDGLYACSGQFVAMPTEPRVQIYGLSSCRLVDPVALKKTCPPTTP